MARQTIIDWEADSLLVAVTGKRKATAIDAASLQAIGDQAPASKSASEALTRASQELGISKGGVTIVASRAYVEMRTIRIPRIEPDELPDVIRFQAQRQLANMGDSWTLDYVLLPDEGQEMLTALVGAIPPDKLSAMEAACKAANLEVEHVALRPIEIARQAFVDLEQPTSGGGMIVCISEETADILMTKDGQVILVRNTRLPHEADQLARVFSGELRRSLLAAASASPGFEVENTLLIAPGSFASRVGDSIKAVVDAPLKSVDPIDWLPESVSERTLLACQEASRLAAICGVSALPSADKNGIIDFKQPKRRPPKKKNTLRYALAGVAAALMAAAGFSWWVNTNRSLDSELEVLNTEIESKQELVAKAREKIAVVDEIAQFTKGSPNYLDELTYMAEKIPDSSRVILAGPTFTTLSDGTGQIRVNIAADSLDSISEFEDSLRDEQHVVMAREPQESAQPTELYKVEAAETIRIKGRGWNIVDGLSTSSRAMQAEESNPAPAEDASETPEDSHPGQSEDEQQASQEIVDATPEQPRQPGSSGNDRATDNSPPATASS